MLTRRTFAKSVAATLFSFVALSSSLLTGCSAEADLEKVLALLPTVEMIAKSVLSVIASVNPGVAAIISSALAMITAAFSSVQAIIAQYKTNIAGIPPTVLNELDAAIAAIATQMNTIEAQFPGIPAIVAAGIQIGLTAFQAILGYLASILPAPAASMFPRSHALLSARGIQFGTPVAVIPDERTFAQAYNKKMDSAGFHGAHIHADWKWHVIP